jgi:hypothetical protein
MNSPQSHDGQRRYLIVCDADGRTYRISDDDLSRYEMSAEERERIEGYLVADDDTEGFAARVFGLGDWSVKTVLGRPLQPQGGTSISSAASDAWDALSR